jgi:hypothetical protein
MKKKRKSPPRGPEEPIRRSAKNLAAMVRLALEMREQNRIGLDGGSYKLLGEMLVDCVSEGAFGEFVRAMKKHEAPDSITDPEREVWKIFMQLWPENGRGPSKGKVYRAIKDDPKHRYRNISKRSVDGIIDRLRLPILPRQWAALLPFVKFIKFYAVK